MAAFRSAVAVGAHALETDVHLSRDGVVVLSHVRCTVPDHELLRARTGLDAWILEGEDNWVGMLMECRMAR